MQGGATQGLTFQVSYTWSKSINGAGYQNGWPYQDPKQIHQLAGSDRTNVLGITTVYDLPSAREACCSTTEPNRGHVHQQLEAEFRDCRAEWTAGRN